MNRLFNALPVLALAVAVAGCGRVARQELREDRAGHLYKAAMADYAAGRIDAAIDGFEKVVRATPGNASARFQLATLLQDRRKDYLAALCQYREYVLQSPKSDKADLARERAIVCERQFVAAALEKLKEGEGPVAAEIARLKSEIEKLSQDNAKLRDDLSNALQDVESSKRESERVRRLVTSLGDEEPTERPAFFSAKDLLDSDDESQSRPDMSVVKDLLSEESRERPSVDLSGAKALIDDERSERPSLAAAKGLVEDEKSERPDMSEARRLIAEAKEESVDRVKLSADVAMLIADDKAEERSTPFEVAPKKPKPSPAPAVSNEPPHEERPAEYVVQEGDTLYKIAMRFYGKRSAWTRIRDANKTVISMDGRVNAGVTIKLPQ
jgi:nucleoid-associated protein YgaU